MQVSSLNIEQSARLMSTINTEKQSYQLRMNQQFRDQETLQKNKVSSNKSSLAYSQMEELKSVQASYIAAQKRDSYLEKLQKVLERFKEYSQELAQKAVSSDDNSSGMSAPVFQNALGRLSQDIKEMVHDYPMLREITREMGNLRVTTTIGLEKTLTDIMNERKESSRYLNGLEGRIAQNSSESHVDFNFSKMPSSLHNAIKPDVTFSLLEK